MANKIVKRSKPANEYRSYEQAKAENQTIQKQIDALEARLSAVNAAHVAFCKAVGDSGGLRQQEVDLEQQIRELKAQL